MKAAEHILVEGKANRGGGRRGFLGSRWLQLPMPGRVFLFALLFEFGLQTQGDATDANVVSPVITYQYFDAVGEQTNVPVVSPVVCYQYLDALPNATYQTQTSPSVVYYYQNGNQAGPVIAGVNPNPAPGMDGAQSFTISGANFNGSSVVNLTNLTTGISYPNRAILSENGTQIVIKPNFGTTANTWTVQVANGLIASSPYQFTVQAATNSTLQAPIMNSPGATAAPGDIQVNRAINFSWQLVSGADRYDFLISQLNASGGYDLVFSTQASGINLSGTTSSFTLPPGVLKSGGSYRWTMSTHNSAGSGVPSSAFLYFRTPVATSVLPPPALCSPGNNIPPGQSTSSTTPQLTWQPVNGADGYDIYVSIQNPDCTYSPVFDTHALGLTQSAAARSFTMPSGYLQPGHRYLWKMSTENSAGSGPQNTAGLYFQTSPTPSNPPLKINWLTLSPSQADWCQPIIFQGKVVDDKGNPVSGAILTAANPLASGPLLSPQSNQGGFISFPLTVPVNVANGAYTYSFQATKAGYTSSATWLVQLQVNHASATPALSINSSIGGSSVPLGSTQVLTATSTGSVMAYSFALSIDGGQYWLPLGRISNPTSNTASIIVPILGGLSTQCLFKVTAQYLDGSHTATSDAFSIVDPGLSAPYEIPGFSAYRQSQLYNNYPIGMQNSYTISTVGCNLTCLSMMLNFYKAPKSPFTPKTLNDAIHVAKAWGDEGNVGKASLNTIEAVPLVAPALKWATPETGYIHTEEGIAATSPFGVELKKLVAPGVPVKVKISGKTKVYDKKLDAYIVIHQTHYVVVYGWNADGFIIADSAVDLTASNSEDPWYFESNYPMHQASWNKSFFNSTVGSSLTRLGANLRPCQHRGFLK